LELKWPLGNTEKQNYAIYKTLRPHFLVIKHQRFNLFIQKLLKIDPQKREIAENLLKDDFLAYPVNYFQMKPSINCVNKY
jgi:hypothetical protein